MFNLLEGDGIIENLYHLLWTKDSIFENNHNVIIPHTILYKYQKPCYWYFTSKIDNQIKKKSSSKVTTIHIEEIFTRKISKSGIVGYYIYKKSGFESKYEIDNIKSHNLQFDSETDSFNINNNFNDKGKDRLNSQYVIEYFDKKKFNEFLNNKNTYPDGILQQFIDPKGDNNFIIRLYWSPKLCILEKKINKKKIYDRRYNLYERAVTYDGEEFHTDTEAIRGNNLPDRFEKIGNNIASHISNITLERIKIVKMILNFKIGKNDQFYLLWCSSLRIENLLDKKFISSKNEKNKNKLNDIKQFNQTETDKIRVTYPNTVNLFQYSNQGKPIKVYKNTLCKNCDIKIEKHKMCDISFRTLVEAHDSRKRDKNYNKLFENINMTSSGVELLPYIPNKGEEEQKFLVLKNHKNLLIPKVILALYPKINYEDYKVLKKDTVFLSKNSQVCEKCFLDLTKYCHFAGANTENVLRIIKSSVPEDLYVKKENMIQYGRNGFNSTNKNSDMNNNENKSIFNIKQRSKTPYGNVMNSNYIDNNFNNTYNSRKPNVSDLSKLFSSKNNKNKYMPDFSSNIKFVIEPKKKEDEKIKNILNNRNVLSNFIKNMEKDVIEENYEFFENSNKMSQGYSDKQEKDDDDDDDKNRIIEKNDESKNSEKYNYNNELSRESSEHSENESSIEQDIQA